VAPRLKERDEIESLRLRIDALLADAIRHEEQAKLADDPRSSVWHKEQMDRKMDQAFWAEKRLDFLMAGL